MTDQLASNLEHAARLVADTLSAARLELVELEERKVQLLALIARTEAMHAALQTDRPAMRHMTLHEAIAFLIREHGNRWMTVKDLTAAINARQLYHKRDGSPVELNEVHARINNYEYLFDKNGSKVRLREVP
ncbi:MAG: hypothetical protein HZB15_08300 [Actinobacteria bacterium]|nr:hypothetical protein [Actinomycetota bacterium]